MHDEYIGGRSENNIKCIVVHGDLGRKNRTTRYNCRFSASCLYGWFSQFHSCGNYSVLSRSHSVHGLSFAGRLSTEPVSVQLLVHFLTSRRFPRFWNDWRSPGSNVTFMDRRIFSASSHTSPSRWALNWEAWGAVRRSWFCTLAAQFISVKSRTVH